MSIPAGTTKDAAPARPRGDRCDGSFGLGEIHHRRTSRFAPAMGVRGRRLASPGCQRRELPRLASKLDEIVNAETVQAWLIEYGELKIHRDAVAKSFQEDFPRLCRELVAVLQAVKTADKAISNLNVKAPPIAGYHLDAIDPAEISKKVVLPAMDRSAPAAGHRPVFCGSSLVGPSVPIA